ncbi:MAG: hypothetical protein KDB51_09770, partial [Propionibacteriaceae bacterium]|nr:hypothetical protein [Propionibacteriaceae bacterium]
MLTALLGLHRDLTDLPADWPLLSEAFTGPGQFTRLLDDPAAALRSYLHRLLTEVSAEGAGFATTALRLLGRLLPSDLTFDGVSLPGLESSTLRSITGVGRYDDPWVIPIVETSSDDSQGVTTVDALVWLDPDGPPAAWIAALQQVADQVNDGDLLTGLLGRASAFRPQLAAALRGRDPDAVGVGFDDLEAWLLDGDGLVPLLSQLPLDWEHGTTVAVPHALLPTDPGVIGQVVTRLAAGAGPVLL